MGDRPFSLKIAPEDQFLGEAEEFKELGRSFASRPSLPLPSLRMQFSQVPVQEFFDNQLLSYKQAAQYLSVSVPYLRKLKVRGLIPVVLVGDRAVRFRVSSLNHWIEEREVK
jgi:excisionase family DNA binding protein